MQTDPVIFGAKFTENLDNFVHLAYKFHFLQCLLQKMALWINLNISGFNVAHRRRKTGMVGFQHRLTKEDAMKWFQQKVCVTKM